MRRYSKDENFVCHECKDESEEHVDENLNATYVIERSNDTPDTFQSDFESEISEENHDQENVPVDDESSAHDDTNQESITRADEFHIDFESEINEENHDKEEVPVDNESSTHDDTSQKSIDWGELTIDGLPCEGLIFEYVQSEAEVTPPKCEVCERLFGTNTELSKHNDDMHFNSCPICEKTFYRLSLY